MMTVKKLSPLLVDENLAEDYLLKSGVLKTFDSCPKCNSMHIGRIRRERIRCYECKFEWNIRLGSYLEGRHTGLSDFIGCIKLFVDGATASKAADELEVSPRLTMQLFNEFRKLLIGEFDSDSNDKGEVIFVITADNGKIRIDISSDDIRQTGSELKCRRSIDKDRSFIFNFTYTSRKIKPVLDQISRINELDLFYRYCQERIYNFRGRNIDSLLNLLKEIAYRYNHRKEDLFEILTTHLKYLSK